MSRFSPRFSRFVTGINKNRRPDQSQAARSARMMRMRAMNASRFRLNQNIAAMITVPSPINNSARARICSGTLLYRSSKYDCDGCPLKPRCCPTTPSRKVPRDINEDARSTSAPLTR